ncbi:sodium/hydrogen exchanger [Stanieria sp. NIES-3757]|nr:sodium/hydrogen exchanger [Stanieria sp. NIES-3757]
MLTTQIALLLLLLIACLAAIALKRLQVPFTVGLVIIGLVAGWLANKIPGLAILQEITLSHELILFLFVPPLVFESALNMNSRMLSRNLKPVAILAVPGLLLSTAIIGILLNWLTPLDFPRALLFGAMISATDPVAVIALFKEFGVPNRLTILIEGESLFNDASAIVTFNIILAVSASGVFGAATIVQGLFQAVVVFAGGILVGTILAGMMAYILTLAEDNALLQATVSGIVAYLAFIIAEHGFHVSGVIAVMTAGLIVGWLKANRVKPEVRTFLHEFWDYAAFVANSLIFLLIGSSTAILLAMTERELYLESSIFWAIASALLARAAVVYTLIPFVNWLSTSEPVDWRYQTVSFWGGLRGAVALALALSLAPDFPDRDLIMVMTLSVALFTIISGGLTMGNLIHALKLDRPTILDRLEDLEASVKVKRQGWQQLAKLESLPIFSQLALTNLKQEYQQAVVDAETRFVAFWSELNSNPQLIRQAIWTQALSIEKQLYQEICDRGIISQMSLDRLKHSINLKQDALLAGNIPPPQEAQFPAASGWEKLMTTLVRRFIPPEQLMGTQQEFKISYEYHAAVAYACANVAQRIKGLAEQIATKALELPGYEGLDATVVEECAQAYQNYSAAALQRIKARTEYSPELILALQQKLARQTILASEEEALAQFIAEGVISSSIGDRLRHHLEVAEPL